ncbi:MAG: cyclic 2,3-diphosphoglycerate synthase [Anaerolineae bacterium]
MHQERILIMGAAGRDFHNFNTVFKDNNACRVVAFTATQIPNIEGRVYPAELAGSLYPDGIPIYPEADLPRLIAELSVDQVVFSYSDVPYQYVMQKSAQVMAAGADFRLLGRSATMLKSSKPLVSICAVRTGCGKSQTTRAVSRILKRLGKKIAVIRHPMPYGNLVVQAVQRFATLDDLDEYECTIEEREEYEPHIVAGTVVYAGVDYEAILRRAEQEADVILWDGGNNDLPFYRPDMHIVLVDPHRPGHETRYFPGEANLRIADVVVVNKVGTADEENVERVLKNVAAVAPAAAVIKANSPISVEDAAAIAGKRVLVVEDGPTLTHGEMAYGAGFVAAQQYGAAQMIDPRPYAVGSIKETFAKYPTTGAVLPAMGYGELQMNELQQTINATPCDLVLIATPIDLGRLLTLNRPSIRVTYELEEITRPNLHDILSGWLAG